jgi:hypothetical protein
MIIICGDGGHKTHAAREPITATIYDSNPTKQEQIDKKGLKV